MWQQIVKFKYLKSDSINTVKHKQSDSAIWADLLKVKDLYLQGRKMIIKDGRNTLFWKDTWLFDKPLNIVYPNLFKLCEQKNMTVQHVKHDCLGVTFTR